MESSSENDMKYIVEELKRLNEKMERMDKHIHFIEGVYSFVKYPLGYLCNKINKISGSSKTYTVDDK